MIKNGKEVPVPEVELGNLTAENAMFVNADPADYPMSWMAEWKGTTLDRYCEPVYGTKDPVLGAGEHVEEQYVTPHEALCDYADHLRKEFENTLDQRFIDNPWGCFHGRKLTHRWHNEGMRRGLIADHVSG